MEQEFLDSIQKIQGFLCKHPEIAQDNRVLCNLFGDYILDSDVKLSIKKLVDDGFIKTLNSTSNAEQLKKFAYTELCKYESIDGAGVAVNILYRVIKSKTTDLIDVSHVIDSKKRAAELQKQAEEAHEVELRKKERERERIEREKQIERERREAEKQRLRAERREGFKRTLPWLFKLLCIATVCFGVYKFAPGIMKIFNKMIDASGANYNQEKALAKINDYCNDMVKAINSGDFGCVSKHIEDGSPLYKQQKKLVASLSSKSIREEFVTGGGDTYYDEKSNVIVAKIFEKHKMMYPSGKVSIVDNFWKYTLSPEPPYKLRTIRRGVNPYKKSVRATINTDDTDIYTGASTSSLLFARGALGDRVKVFKNKTASNSDGDWIWIKHPEFGYGWVRSQYLSY